MQNFIVPIHLERNLSAATVIIARPAKNAKLASATSIPHFCILLKSNMIMAA
jgi:hypothetical protein